MVPVRNREWWCPHEVWTLAKLHAGDMTGPSSPDYIVKPFVRYSPKPRLFSKRMALEVAWNLALGQRN